MLLLSTVLAGCGSGVKANAGFKPKLLPVSIEISTDGTQIRGDVKLITPVGTFSVGASYSLPERPPDTIYIIIRDRKPKPTGFDHIYQVRNDGDALTAVVNGTTVIEVRNGQVLIDVTAGTIKRIQFQRTTGAALKEGTDNPVQAWWDHQTTKWDQNWHDSFYTPFAMFSWAYDDSTISRWFGLGFVWYLLRLVLALLLAVADLVLSLGFLLGALAYLLFGNTGRNITYGLLVLFVIVVGWFSAASA